VVCGGKAGGAEVSVRSEIKRVIGVEAAALNRLKAGINADFEKAVKLLYGVKGKVVISGIGKSGLIGQKISATLSSTGTPSIYLHSTEAAHGDLGIINKKDVVIIISQSGETEEVIDIIPTLNRLKVPIIAVTGRKGSTLGKAASCVLDSSVSEEACPMGLAPTASTTVQLAIGDAVAVALLKKRGFKKADFAMIHPGGALGKRLLLRVKDIMHTGKDVPVVSVKTTVKSALVEMTRKRLGCTAVTGKAGRILGIFTDGDLRRLIEKNPEPFSVEMGAIMTKNPGTIGCGALAAQALKFMEKKKITVLLVAGKKNRLDGIIHLHDILKSGIA